MKTNSLKRKITILDTDIGDDIDDTWALAMALKSPELDLRMVSTAYQDTEYRGRIVAKFLKIAGRTDVAVALGPQDYEKPENKRQMNWVKDYDLKSYGGKVFSNGIDAMIEFIMAAEETVTIICIGPGTNIAAALEKEPRIAEKCFFAGMHGSIHWSHRKENKVIPEYNVVSDISAAQKIFEANWKDIIITPLDTCGRIKLKGNLYESIREADDIVLKTLIENYEIWSGKKDMTESSILFDTVAVHLAYSREFLSIKDMNIGVDKKGYTVIDETAKACQFAIEWTDMDGYENYLVKRLLSPTVNKKGES
ncbi:MAG: hypothetical protein A2017_08010 [Lentisphaerae bacterium GWF2_44_16]|nr:MAG: hypothetical protein A2017_08010 [Lentisphaerae bacterium GWF2_44_16]